MSNLTKYFFISFIFIILINKNIESAENRILFKVNNEIITSIDILNELRYLKTINEKFKITKEKQAFEIAKRSLIREKIKEIELKKIYKEIKLEDKFLNNVLTNYFTKIQIDSVSDFNNFFTSINIDPELIKKKIIIDVLWSQLIFNKYNNSVKINKQDIIKNLKNNNRQKEFFLYEILFNINKDEKLDDKFNLIKNKINQSNFSEAALIYSVSDTSNRGGELGWIKEATLNKKIKDILQNIKIGNYSNPILIPSGFLILKIEDIREVDNYFEKDKEIEKIIKEKTNEQLNQFSNIYFKKIQKDVTINEL